MMEQDDGDAKVFKDSAAPKTRLLPERTQTLAKEWPTSDESSTT